MFWVVGVTEKDYIRRVGGLGQLLTQAERGVVGKVSIENHHVGLATHEHARRQRSHVQRRHNTHVRLSFEPDRQGISEGSLLKQDEEANRHAGSLAHHYDQRNPSMHWCGYAGWRGCAMRGAHRSLLHRRERRLAIPTGNVLLVLRGRLL